ncbi:hypothetical protein Pmani_016659 [Petrolisthes manimaculis]|uniref:Uncharacterized protein n=1 Tax=Petrolisthes manimaculis TaxID=1843537 RepID=A0AAE1PR76_9EUCA|nr:hypothetical protein Pmani_016659 [Petrolisthes manimaculis]
MKKIKVKSAIQSLGSLSVTAAPPSRGVVATLTAVWQPIQGEELHPQSIFWVPAADDIPVHLEFCRVTCVVVLASDYTRTKCMYRRPN